MKKLLYKISACIAAMVMFCLFVGCSVLVPPTEPPQLSTPAVTIDEEGVASWAEVPNASYYAYVIDGGKEKLTNDCRAYLSENQSISVKAVSGSDAYSDSEFSAPKTYIKAVAQTTLSVPEVVIDKDGVASWSVVKNAQYYVYVIDDGEEERTTEPSVRLEDGQSIKVKAGSDAAEYRSSDFSKVKTYVKATVKTKLSTPEITIDEDGTASWNEVQNAQYYVYVIDNGVEIKTTETSIELTNGQSIKVKAASYAEEYTASDFSQEKTYTKTTIPPDEHTHVDADGDDICDTCNKKVKTELSFFAVNDLHGKFMDTDNQPGLDEFTTYLKGLYEDTSREEILLSSGDMWQGTVESSSNKGQLMTEWMNEVGFSSMTLGNHEYDWGARVLTPNSELADFPFLAINVTYNGKPVDYCQGSTVVEKGGMKIGIIGAIGNCLSSISGEFSSGLNFATGDELTSLVKAESNRLRSAEGCDFIVYSIHDGYESSLSYISSVSSSDFVTSKGYIYYDTSLSNGYVDLVFEGHTHQSYILKDEYGVYHLQGGGENRYISRADVSYNAITAQYTVKPVIVEQSVYANSSLQDDPAINKIFNKYFPDNNPYTTVLGRNASYKNGTAICDTVAELYYTAGQAEWGDRYDIVLGGGFLKSRSPYRVSAGNVTYAALFSVLPFDNEIVLGKISGYYLKSKFLQTTNSDYHCHATVKADEVSDNQYYYIVVDSYSSTYAPNHIQEVARMTNGKYARDLLADFISAGGWE